MRTNQFQTRETGRRAPSTDTSGQSMSTATAYQSWSATAGCRPCQENVTTATTVQINEAANAYRQAATSVVEVTALDNSRGIVDWPEDYFATITTAYIAARGLAPRPVGAAPSFLLDADDLARFGADWMERNFAQARTS